MGSESWRKDKALILNWILGVLGSGMVALVVLVLNLQVAVARIEIKVENLEKTVRPGIAALQSIDPNGP